MLLLPVVDLTHMHEKAGWFLSIHKIFNSSLGCETEKVDYSHHKDNNIFVC